MTIKILMIPSYADMANQANGIARVIEAYYKYLPAYGVELVTEGEYDLKVVHAGITSQDCDVSHLHGLYWTADYNAPRYEYMTNANIVRAVRNAKGITVPSPWVAEVFRRDMHINPYVVPHGIDSSAWINTHEKQDYILWNKNRGGIDVCSTESLSFLSGKFSKFRFVSTFLPSDDRPNIQHIGVLSPTAMKDVVQKAGVYLSTTKETFGIGILEAMASGIPVLGYDFGGNRDLVKHKVNGYLAEPNNKDDLAYGLEYCIANRKQLGENGVVLAREWTWEKAVDILYNVYTKCMHNDPPSVSIVIPCYNKSGTVERAIRSALDQTVTPREVILVNDGSSDSSLEVLNKYKDTEGVTIIDQPNQGVAHARNNGVLATTSKYVCCLDGDDWIEPDFTKVCIDALEADRSLGIAYTRIMTHHNDGRTSESAWPAEFDYDEQVRGKNQIPTCCVYTRSMFDRLGGYRQRYAPMGAGSEDAEFWLRAGSIGCNATLASRKPLFNYSLGTGITASQGYREVDWKGWHSWTRNNLHPFASIATPVRLAHVVRQYDEPLVSVIIPVGNGHEKEFINALDSLEAQTFTRWEALVVWDSDKPIDDYTQKAFPFVKWFQTESPKSGPGAGRNIGASNAQGKWLMFLDADDWLYPNAIETMLMIGQNHEGVIYSDYVGKAIIDPDSTKELGKRLLTYNESTNEAVIRHYASDYDCEKAQRQPDIDNQTLYHWCLVTCLIPRKLHFSINGFDESMPSWEDVDYHWRLARAGACYTRIPEPLLVYRFTTGNRRESAMEVSRAQYLIKYMNEKYRSIETMPCPGGCGKSRAPDPQLNIGRSQQSPSPTGLNDNEFVMCRYTTTNSGDHNVIGASTINKKHLNYGYRCAGDVFLVHKSDIFLTPQLFRPIEMETPLAKTPDREIPKENPKVVDTGIPTLSQPKVVAPIPLAEFLSDKIAKILLDGGFQTAEDIVASDAGTLSELHGIGETRAKQILTAASKVLTE